MAFYTGPSINAVFARHGSDKAVHNYGHAYAAILNMIDSVRSLLEIGVKEGASMRAWRELMPGAKLIGVDNDPKATMYYKATIIADQERPNEVCSRVKKFAPFDLIIDDGCHIPQPTWNTMTDLWPLLRVGGVYVIEDLDAQYYSDLQDGTEAIYQRIAGRLEAECVCSGTRDRITLIAGELAAFVKVQP